MNPNLINPEIVTRLAQEREQEFRRTILDLPESEREHPVTPKARAQQRHHASFLTWLFAFVMR